jgi:fatty acid desaturase
MTATVATPAASSDYAVLKRRVQAAGLLERESRFYIRSIVGKMTLLAASLTVFVILRSHPWVALPNAVVLAIIFGQLGFQLHDAGHRQMFQSQHANVVVGLLTADLLLGMSYGWWVDKHNRHHANPNHVDMDPDIGPGVISYSEEQALASRGVRRFIAKHQAGLFFPLLLGLAWAMHWKSLVFLRHRSHYQRLEVALIALHAVLFVGFLVLVLGPSWAVIVVVVQQCCGGFYLASVFAANHKGMPQVSGRVDHLRRQVLTSRNVRSNPLTDVWYGALNYQIEHHLFPTMSRNRVAAAHGIVRQFCEERGIAYTETSVLQSYREILSFLHEVGAPVRQPQEAGWSPAQQPRAVELLGDGGVCSSRIPPRQ